ncbi:hypothetical protein AYX15_06032 [Cryptococcus neoformans]|nr:hypothetical protein AYX15_06032 [Cryptococcus neoformans var. grubii]
MASVDNRLSKHGGENAPFQSRFTKQETYEWHRICLRATEIMPSVTQIVLTAAGSGKNMVWILQPLAMKMHKQSGILILFGVTKATQDDQIRTLKRLHFEANFLNGDSPRDVRQKLAVMKGQLWAIGWGMLQNHLVQEVLGKSALTGKILSRLVGEAHTIKEGGPSWRPDIPKLCEIRDILGPSSATGLFSAIMSPDRDELKYEVRPFRAKMDTYADLGIISQGIYFLWPKPLTTTPTAVPQDLSLSSLSCNFSSFPPTTSHAASPMTASTSGRKEIAAQQKETGDKFVTVLRPLDHVTALVFNETKRGRRS